MGLKYVYFRKLLSNSVYTEAIKLFNNVSSTGLALSGSLYMKRILFKWFDAYLHLALLRLSFTLQISYEYLIVALGLELHFEKVK